MEKDIVDYAKSRYSAKAFDASKKISSEDFEKVKELLRLAPSSVNAQPWHFVIASSDEGKAKVTSSAKDIYEFNVPSILNASHVVVFATKKDVDEEYLLKVLAQEEKDGRYDAEEASKDMMHGARTMFVNIHKEDIKDLEEWFGKQVYINLGSFLLGVEALGINAVPMEGFDADILDKELGLDEKGYRSLVVVPIGYSDPEGDYNAGLPKSRLEYSEILTEI